MNELERIADQLERSLRGEAWHGPSLLESLAGCDAHAAVARPIASAHTIWEIVLHLTSTYRLVLRRLRGDRSPLTPEEDWPDSAAAADEAAWTAAVGALRTTHQELLRELQLQPLAALDDPGAQGSSSLYVAAHGLVQHNLYHAGQIVLLRKAA